MLSQVIIIQTSPDIPHNSKQQTIPVQVQNGRTTTTNQPTNQPTSQPTNQPIKFSVGPSVGNAHCFDCVLKADSRALMLSHTVVTCWSLMGQLILYTPPQLLQVVASAGDKLFHLLNTIEAYSFTSVVLPHSIDPLLGSIVDVSHQTLPVGRPFHVVIALYFILLCCLCQ